MVRRWERERGRREKEEEEGKRERKKKREREEERKKEKREGEKGGEKGRRKEERRRGRTLCLIVCSQPQHSSLLLYHDVVLVDVKHLLLTLRPRSTLIWLRALL